MADTDIRPPQAEEKDPEIKVVDRRWWVQPEAGTQEGADQARFELRKPTYVEELERQLAEKDKQLQDTIARYKEATREFDAVKARLRRDVVKDIERGKGAILAELLDVVDNLNRAIDAAQRAPGLPTLSERPQVEAKAGSPTGKSDDAECSVPGSSGAESRRPDSAGNAGSPPPDSLGTAASSTPDRRGNAGLQNGGDRLLEGVEMVRNQFLAKLEGLGVKRMAPLGKPFDPARHEAASLVPVADAAQDNRVLCVIREGYEFNSEVLRPALVAVGQMQP